MTTDHRPAMRVEVRKAVTPDGRLYVLFQTDEWHVLIPPAEAIDIGEAITAAAREIHALESQ